MIEKSRKLFLLHSAAVAGLAGALALGMAGCKSNTAPAPIVGDNGQDPAAGNLAQPYTGGTAGTTNAGYSTGASSSSAGSTTRVLSSSQSYAPQASGESYGSYSDDQQAAAPIIRQAPAGQNYNTQGYNTQGYDTQGYNTQGGYDQGYNDAEEAGEEAIADTDQAPPPLPEYDQPPAPEPNYLWTPGYWNYAPTGYYWVPGAWCAPPYYGALWTPPYWGYYGGHYAFHRGYWGPHIGFYGGVNYGFGYIGVGYFGGYWHGRDFVYNRAVTNVNVTVIHNTYINKVVYNGVQYGPHPQNRVSYNGGRGGLSVQPTPNELAAAHEPHYPPVAAQRELRVAAASNRGQFFAANGGRPAMAIAPRPVGAPQMIAAAPREQPFNRAGVAPNAAGNRPMATMPGNPGAGRPGTPAFRPGAGPTPAAVAPNARPGFEGNRPNTPNASMNRPNTPAPAAAPNTRPGFEGNRPGTPPNVNRPNMAQPNRPAGGAQPPAYNQSRPAAPMQQPGQRPNVATPRPEAAAPRPEAAPIQRTQPAPVQRQEPTVVQRPEPAARPAYTPPPARPAPQAHAAPAPQPHAAPAPHGGEGGGGGEHRDRH